MPQIAATGDRVHEKVESEPRRNPLLSGFDGLKQKASEFLGGANKKTSEAVGEIQDKSRAHEGSGKQAATQMLNSAQNETADTFGDSTDRKTLSESTAGHVPSKAASAGSVWDATEDKTRTREYHTAPEGVNWNEIKQKASQFLGSAQNEVADTVNDSADRSTLSESTLGANKPRAGDAGTPWDVTHEKTKSDEYETPAPGVNWNGLKLKASQILESFGNETADTFDTIQDREVISESSAGAGAAAHHKAGDATSPFDHTSAKIPVHDKAREAAANFDQRMADASKSAQEANEEAHAHSTTSSTGLTWDGLKAKASEVLGSIQQSTKSSADSAREAADNAANKSSGVWDDVSAKLADISSVAQDRANAGVVLPEEPVFSSETRRATAGQVADYANH